MTARIHAVQQTGLQSAGRGVDKEIRKGADIVQWGKAHP